MKILEHGRRYRVEYWAGTRWKLHDTYRFAWLAKRTARFRDSLGYFEYRVIDTKDEA